MHRDQHVLAGRGLAFGFDVLLTDFTEENGATELWPGSHALPDLDAREASCAAERAALLPSVRIVALAGSIVARDLRAWHRATANRTDAPRLMLSLSYAAASGAQPTS